MRVLLGFAALAATALASSAQAQESRSSSFAMPSARHTGTTFPQWRSANQDGMVHVHRGSAGSYGYVDYSAYDDFDANRSFDHEKWNDWWHDRPDRAYPRWLSRNQDCARLWYSADKLTC